MNGSTGPAHVPPFEAPADHGLDIFLHRPSPAHQQGAGLEADLRSQPGEPRNPIQQVPAIELKDVARKNLRRPLADPFRPIALHQHVPGLLHLNGLRQGLPPSRHWPDKSLVRQPYYISLKLLYSPVEMTPVGMAEPNFPPPLGNPAKYAGSPHFHNVDGDCLIPQLPKTLHFKASKKRNRRGHF